MSLSLQLGSENMVGLLLGSPFLTADPLDPLLDKDEERSFSEGSTSPLSFSSYADSTSTLPSLSPPSSPPCLLDSKPVNDLLPLSWLDAPLSTDGGQEDAFSSMDWMAEKIDLSEFDLESFFGSCESDDSPSSPEDLITSLESDMGLDPLQFPTPAAQVPSEELDLMLPGLSHLSNEHEVDVKSEPPSPVPSPTSSPGPSFSTTFTLELGSEVEVLEGGKSAPAESVPGPQIVLSFPGSQIFLLVSPKEEADTVPAVVPSSFDDQLDSDSSLSSDPPSPGRQFCSTPPPVASSCTRTKPYSHSVPVQESMTSKLKSASSKSRGMEKKLKKMEQNKTAATRYRQKKRAEQEILNVEYRELEKRNRELIEKADSISKEIQYLKDLMEEVQAAKSKRSKPRSVAF
ncbi:cyclic AMP-dependent transcription factor ATF-4-like [Scleropages formosus]|uniref:Cyclic AMP-dependent transcription factor ATF-4 n=1 Tax=Scleropages formosus TaxID=113540 RepID=A0A0P7T8Y5_SCLFO|nr:cyclic AMP-dependent transcription factor ATF-4 [Scleropages formosus]KPP57387.1 cyclic AMP-dependent transcription factor ATF-4-like [Scleropages formosus]